MEIVTIGDEDFLLRRVPHYPMFYKPDGTLSKAAFTLRDDEEALSADLERLTDHATSVIDGSKYRLARINAGMIRNSINDGLDCIHHPEEQNYAHSLITSSNGISKAKARAMAAAATYSDQL